MTSQFGKFHVYAKQFNWNFATPLLMDILSVQENTVMLPLKQDKNKQTNTKEAEEGIETSDKNPSLLRSGRSTLLLIVCVVWNL